MFWDPDNLTPAEEPLDALGFLGALYMRTATNLYRLDAPAHEDLAVIVDFDLKRITSATAVDVTPAGCASIYFIHAEGATLWLGGSVDATTDAVWSYDGTTWTRRGTMLNGLLSWCYQVWVDGSDVYFQRGTASAIRLRGQSLKAVYDTAQPWYPYQTHEDDPEWCPELPLCSGSLVPVLGYQSGYVLYQGALWGLVDDPESDSVGVCSLSRVSPGSPTHVVSLNIGGGSQVGYAASAVVANTLVIAGNGPVGGVGEYVAVRGANVTPSTTLAFRVQKLHGDKTRLVGIGSTYVGSRWVPFVFASIPHVMVYSVELEWAEPHSPTVSGVTLEWSDAAGPHNSPTVSSIELQWATPTGTHTSPTVSEAKLEWHSTTYDGPEVTSICLEWAEPPTPTVSSVVLEWADAAGPHLSPTVQSVALEWLDEADATHASPTVSSVELQWRDSVTRGPTIDLVSLEWAQSPGKQAGEEVRWVVYDFERDVGKLRVHLQAADTTLYRMAYRMDLETLAADNWAGYKPIEAGAEVLLDGPGRIVRLAIFKQVGTAKPTGLWITGE